VEPGPLGLPMKREPEPRVAMADLMTPIAHRFLRGYHLREDQGGHP
jgi:hypothetical protein